MPTAPDKLHYYVRTRSFREDRPPPPHYIFFITGNPGLIGYYEPFLSTLSSLLATTSKHHHHFHILGTSLSGFEAGGSTTTRIITNGHGDHPPYGLPRQIELVEERLRWFVRESSSSKRGQNYGYKNRDAAKVILIGHSVGAYILLELIRRHRTCRADVESPLIDIVGGILLFPTITHIAKSPSGIWFSSILQLPYFAFLIGALVRVLIALLPELLLYQLARRLIAFPDHAAKTTMAFLHSRLGVTQALYMAKDEMQMITEDKWGQEVWGVARDSTTDTSEVVGRPSPSPKLIFYFGENDHWVANNTRDSLIAARCSSADEGAKLETQRPIMLIDMEGIPHGFCINHSEIIAEKVRAWIEGITWRE